ncbi:MAG: C10 family peptidase [Bacteroidetes bacterium]|nr:C10 family peptidase [Bacteroidota bacterium]
MKKTTLFICSLLFTHFLSGQTVTIEHAKNIAQNFYSIKMTQSESKTIPTFSQVFTEKENDLPVYYIFNSSNNGFIIVSADLRAYPILAYSFENNFNPSESHSPGFLFWMNRFKKQISELKMDKSLKANPQWQKIENNISSKNTKLVTPLIKSKWNQDAFYNEACPADAGGPGGHAYAGCVPTAMGQIMNYYRYPPTGIGSYTYTDATYGLLSADFGATTYDWNSMPMSINYSCPSIATLLFHLGVSVDLNYGPGGSGITNHKAAYALRTNFGYLPSTEYIFRDTATINWKNMLIGYLDNKMPLYYAGWSDTSYIGGHAFVCDGYQDTTHFHFNWGWSGTDDGYFFIDNLNPSGYDFTLMHEVIRNIYPAVFYPSGCSGLTNINSSSGTIEDGSGPISNYSNNANCSWLIAPTDSVSKITLTFLSFETVSSQDFVTVYDGATTSAPLLGTYSGSSLPAAISSTGNKMLVTFTSDSDSTGQGFLAEFKSTFPIYCTNMTLLTNPSGSFSDGSGNADYHNNSNCKWAIQPAGASSITLNFTEFNTQGPSDNVKIYDASTSALLANYSGSNLPASVVCNSGSMLVIFFTNGSITSSGWSANYSSTTGINTFDKSNLYEIFPNPNNGIFNILLKTQKVEQRNLSVYNSLGQNVFSKSLDFINTNETIDLSNLSKGIYHLCISSETENANFNLVIE